MKKIYLLCLIVLMPVLTFGQAKKIYRKALRTDNVQEKIELLTQVIALEPKHYDAYFHRGIAKNDIGDYFGAIMDYSKIIVFNPDPNSYFNRGNSKFSLQDYEGAKLDYEHAFKLDPEFYDALYNLALTKYFLEDYQGSITDINTLIKVAPKHSELYLHRANAYIKLKKYEFAMTDFTTAILINPNTNTYYSRGLALLQINYFEAAKNDFDKSITIDTNNVSAHFYRGAAHLLLGKYKEAISDFTTTLNNNPLDYEALLGLALTYYKLNDLKNAKLNLEKVRSVLAVDSEKPITVESFTDTFWYIHQFYFFKENLDRILKI